MVSMFDYHQSNMSHSTIFIDSFSCSGVSLEMKEFELSAKRHARFCPVVQCAIYTISVKRKSKGLSTDPCGTP